MIDSAAFQIFPSIKTAEVNYSFQEMVWVASFPFVAGIGEDEWIGMALIED